LLQSDRSKLIPHVDYLEKELPFLSEYKKEIDWKVYELQRSKRLEIERWVENLINATLDISKMVLTIMGDEIPETSREVLFKVGSHIYAKEEEAETFSELAKIRDTLAHRVRPSSQRSDRPSSLGSFIGRCLLMGDPSRQA
jgi:uncharacterized protein YutE (UPF0331/DUF86 family)